MHPLLSCLFCLLGVLKILRMFIWIDLIVKITCLIEGKNQLTTTYIMTFILLYYTNDSRIQYSADTINCSLLSKTTISPA